MTGVWHIRSFIFGSRIPGRGGQIRSNLKNSFKGKVAVGKRGIAERAGEAGCHAGGVDTGRGAEAMRVNGLGGRDLPASGRGSKAGFGRI